jgi:DNA-binding CsgD family transcriptional regulator
MLMRERRAGRVHQMVEAALTGRGPVCSVRRRKGATTGAWSPSVAEAIDATRLSSLLGHIYQCAIDRFHWPVAMEEIRAELGCANASLDLVSLTDGCVLLHVDTNIPEPYSSLALDYGPELADLWGGADRLYALPLDEPAVLSRTVPSVARMREHRMFVEWAHPQGIDDVIALWLARDHGAVGVLGFGRAAAAGPPGDATLALARLLVPHLQRATAISRLLDLSALKGATFTSLFDTLSAPVFLVDDTVRVLHANDAARAIVRAGEPLRTRGGILRAAELGVSQALAVAVKASGDMSALHKKGMGIPVRCADGGVAALYVLPLSPIAERSFDPEPFPHAVAAVFMAQPSAAPVAEVAVVSALFGLTLAEARVFEGIAEGQSIADIADRLGVQESTVRTHLLRVYDKTGVRRQTDLVRMATALAAPVTAAPTTMA